MESSSSEPLPASKKDYTPYKASKNVADFTKSQTETKLSDARKTVRDLALKIEESNSRTKSMKQKTLNWHEQEHEACFKNKDDMKRVLERVLKDIERIKHELNNLKLDMKRVLEGKQNAESALKASSFKELALTSVVERITKEIEEIEEEHVLVELARIEAVKEREAIEAQKNEEAYNYQIQLEEVKKKVKEVDQHDELTQELELTLYNVNLLEKELAEAKETNGNPDSKPDSLHKITEELETAKVELDSIKRERINFMIAIDVIKNELKLVLEETACLEIEEEKQEFMIQTLNSKILKENTKLESVTDAAEKANAIVSNLSLAVEQLRAETKTAKRENERISEEIEKIKLEINKTDLEIELSEKMLEAAMEDLKTTKESELTALENLKNMIDSTVQSRELTFSNKSTIKITNFEYEYLTRKASGAEEIADKKVVAAQAWVETLKANENEILMKIKMVKQEIKKFHVETVDGELDTWGQNGDNVLASRRMSMYRIGNMTHGKRVRSQKLSFSGRRASKSASLSKKREKVATSLEKLLNENYDTSE